MLGILNVDNVREMGVINREADLMKQSRMIGICIKEVKRIMQGWDYLNIFFLRMILN